MKFKLFMLCLVCFAGISSLLTGEAAESQDLVVGVKPAPPFVIFNPDGGYAGFSVDLIEHIAASLDPPRTIKYVPDPDLPAHLERVKRGGVDLGIAATTVTSKREKEMDFSHPFYQSSLGILMREDQNKPSFLKLIFQRIYSKGFLKGFLGLALFVVISAHLIWFFELGENNFNDAYRIGVPQGIWWTIVTMSTVGYGDFYPKRFWGKVMGAIVIITGIAVFTFVVAGISSLLTVNQLQSAINGPEDLAGKRVAVVQGTVASDKTSEYTLYTANKPGLEAAIESLQKGEVTAVVHDTPLLQYWLKSNPESGLVLADKTFDPSYYGITFPQGSALREEVNVRLLRLMQEDFPIYAAWQSKWFGGIAH